MFEHICVENVHNLSKNKQILSKIKSKSLRFAEHLMKLYTFLLNNCLNLEIVVKND